MVKQTASYCIVSKNDSEILLQPDTNEAKNGATSLYVILPLVFFNTIPCYELMDWGLHLFLCLTHGRISPYSLKSNLIDSKFFCLLFRLLPGDVPFSDTRTVRGAKDVMLPQLSDHSSWSSCYLGWVNGKKRVWTETAVVVYEVVHMGLRPWPYLTPPFKLKAEVED